MSVGGKRSFPVLWEAVLAGPVLMMSAALLFTICNVLIKLLGPHYSVWHIGFFRFFGGALLLLILFGGRTGLRNGRNKRLLLIRGAVGTTAFIMLIAAIRMIPISTAMVIFYCYPAFAALFAFLLYGQRIGRAEMGCIAAAVAGTGILLDFQTVGVLAGQIMSLAAGILAGITVTLINVLRRDHGPIPIYFYFCLAGAAASLPQYALAPLLPATVTEWSMVLGLIVTSAVAQLLMNQGFHYCRGWEGGVFMSAEVVFTAVTGIAFMHDPATPRFWTGGLMIFGSVLALNRIKAGAPSPETEAKSIS